MPHNDSNGSEVQATYAFSGRASHGKVRSMDSDVLRSWFQRSLVSDESGNPKIVTHATDEESFIPELRYGMGPHFSDVDTALTRFEQRIIDGAPLDTCYLYRAYLRIERPVRMRDVHFDELCTFIDGLLETGVILEAEVTACCGRRKFWYGVTPQQNRELIARVVELLRDRGYDGIAYRNFIEGGGALTWIPFSLEQIMATPENQLASDTPRLHHTTAGFVLDRRGFPEELQ